MGSEHSVWERFSAPGSSVEFSYPAVTPQGHAVERTEQRIQDHRGDLELVHLTSPGSSELYVEVGRFRGLTPQEEYVRHRPYLERRFGAESVTPLTETSAAERPAWTYGFRWRDGERSVVLLAVGADTYRFLYDPRSPLNAQILATLALVD